MSFKPAVHYLRQAGVSLVIDATRPDRLPVPLHWGRDLGALDSDDLAALVLATDRVTGTSLPTMQDPGLLAEPSTGWLGQPSVLGHRRGKAWSPKFEPTSTVLAPALDADGTATTQRLIVTATDHFAHLNLTSEIELLVSGLVRIRHTLTNTGDDEYQLDSLVPHLPVAQEACELLDLTGRHCLDRVPIRSTFTTGTHLHDTRRGRTGADGASVMVAGERGFGFGRGEVWGVHLAWSGNHRAYAERTSAGEQVLAAGELLWPGELILAPGDDYRTPWLYGAYGASGMDSMSARFHAYVRGLPHIRDRDRPVTLNSWEALGFHVDVSALLALAEAGAEAGVQRFVLDDGWFGGRRDDTSSLGDWWVSPDVYPDGLKPVVSRVRELGMEFGIWFEPEMVNEDSELARAHPEWILRVDGRLPARTRHQQVLDLTVPAAWEHILESMSAVIAEHDVDFVKWDHNRDLIDAGRGADGRAATHAQTLAFYRMLDTLRARFPRLVIESCASGGARIDFGVVERVDRFWTSDNVDPHDRQTIQRWTQLLMPPEVLGAHVGAPRAGASQRVHRLRFRAGTALLGDFGIEWDLTTASRADRAEIAIWVALARELQPLLRTGRLVRSDHPDPATWVHGVVAQDASSAIYSVVSMESTASYTPGRVRLPGLDPKARYRIEVVAPAVAHNGYIERPRWVDEGPIVVSGQVLASVGLEAPVLWPDDVALVAAARVE
ncbi:alpha-galactosidase [Oerskovia enterophila]|uniref:alpha-galactosidase n=1 Tax=Oerskovia enterophila TaxID=43678 RepID=UPI003393A450